MSAPCGCTGDDVCNCRIVDEHGLPLPGDGSAVNPYQLPADDITIRQEGSFRGERPALNFHAGDNVSLTITDDAGNDEVDITIAATGDGGSTPDFVVNCIPSCGTVRRLALLLG